MTRELHLGLIGLGEVGQVLASDLHLKQGVKLCAWDRLFALENSEPQRAAAALPGTPSIRASPSYSTTP